MGIFKVFFKKFEKFLIYVFKCNGNVGDIGNVCPLRHGVNAVPPFSGENGNPFGLRPFPLTGEFPASGGGFKMAGGHTFCRMSAVDI